MNSEMIRQRISAGTQGQALVIVQTTYDEDGLISNEKRGIVSIAPGADVTKVARKAATYKWNLTGTPNAQGLYPTVTKGELLTDEELSSLDISASGRSFSCSFEQVEESEEVIQND